MEDGRWISRKQSPSNFIFSYSGENFVNAPSDGAGDLG